MARRKKGRGGHAKPEEVNHIENLNHINDTMHYHQQYHQPSLPTQSSGSTGSVITKTLGLGFATQVIEMKVSEMKPIVTEIKPGTFSMDMWWGIVAFFKKVYDVHRSEAQVRLYYNIDTNQWDRVAYKQNPSGGLSTTQTMDARPERLSSDRWIVGGSGHSHNDIGAFQSGVDLHDELGITGVHYTVGKLGQPILDLHGRVYHEKILTNIPWWSIFDVGPDPDWLVDLETNPDHELRVASDTIRKRIILAKLAKVPETMPQPPEDLMAALEIRATSTVGYTGGYSSGSSYGHRGSVYGTSSYTGKKATLDTRKGLLRTSIWDMYGAFINKLSKAIKEKTTASRIGSEFEHSAWAKLFEFIQLEDSDDLADFDCAPTENKASMWPNVGFNEERSGTTLSEHLIMAIFKVDGDHLALPADYRNLSFQFERDAYNNISPEKAKDAELQPYKATNGVSVVGLMALIMLETFMSCGATDIISVCRESSIKDIREFLAKWSTSRTGSILNMPPTEKKASGGDTHLVTPETVDPIESHYNMD